DTKLDGGEWREEEIVLILAHDVRTFAGKDADDFQADATKAEFLSKGRFSSEQFLRDCLPNEADCGGTVLIFLRKGLAFRNRPVADVEIIGCGAQNAPRAPVAICVDNLSPGINARSDALKSAALVAKRHRVFHSQSSPSAAP